MKKMILSLLFVTVALFQSAAANLADRDKAITVDRLPQTAQEFLKSHFNGKKVSYAKHDTEWFDQSYTVCFTDGMKIEFDSKGVWEEMSSHTVAIPVKALPEGIVKYVNEFYPETGILKIERERRGWEVKLSTGVKIEFDSQFRVYDIDYKD